MDTTWTLLVVSLVVLFHYGCTDNQESDVQLYFKDGRARRQLVGAENLKFTCFINQDAMYVLRNPVSLYHIQEWSSKKTQLFQGTTRMDAEEEFYDVEFGQIKRAGKSGSDDSAENSTSIKQFDVGVYLTLTIKKLRYQDDGSLVCRTGEDNPVEASVEIFVEKELEKVRLHFDDLPVITADQNDFLEVDAGHHSIKCVAEGSNPPPDVVHLSIGSDKIETDHTHVEIMTFDPVRQYNSTVEAVVDIRYKSHDSQDVLCQATDSTGKTMSVKLPILVRTPQPNITCQDGKGHVGSEVKLTCRVDHKDIKIDRFMYKISDGESVYEVIAGDSQTIKARKVVVEEHSDEPGVSFVHLIMPKIHDDIFKSSIHLVVESSGGYLSMGKINLEELSADVKDESESHAVTVTSSVVVMISNVLLWVLL